jgi:hypothetical protein
MRTATSAAVTCGDDASASEYTATDRMPSRRRVRITRTAISPRLATSTVSNTVRALLGDGGGGHGAHIRKTPKAGSARGAFAAADRDRPSTVRVSSGSITPSSHSRAVE